LLALRRHHLDIFVSAAVPAGTPSRAWGIVDNGDGGVGQKFTICHLPFLICYSFESKFTSAVQAGEGLNKK
ncbi:MAG: hypothetical protein ABR557_11115, partial [Pyrinomonadaceae bacterium]